MSMLRRRWQLPTVVVLGAACAAWAAPVGWRGDGTGRFPTAAPVVKWSPAENVIWCLPLPGFSNGSPIVVAERVFTCAEPSSLLCLSALDGHVIWQRTHTLTDMVSAAEREQWAREQSCSSPLFVRDRAYLRTWKHLYCLGPRPQTQ